MFKDATTEEINAVMQDAWTAFHVYRNVSLEQRADFMRAIAFELEECGDLLIQTAMRETNLPDARLRNESARTIYQLESYALACEKGDWLEARIDTAIPRLRTMRPSFASSRLRVKPLSLATRRAPHPETLRPPSTQFRHVAPHMPLC